MSFSWHIHPQKNWHVDPKKGFCFPVVNTSWKTIDVQEKFVSFPGSFPGSKSMFHLHHLKISYRFYGKFLESNPTSARQPHCFKGPKGRSRVTRDQVLEVYPKGEAYTPWKALTFWNTMIKGLASDDLPVVNSGGLFFFRSNRKIFRGVPVTPFLVKRIPNNPIQGVNPSQPSNHLTGPQNLTVQSINIQIQASLGLLLQSASSL